MDKDFVIVSRHAGFVALLAERGIVGKVVAHATADDVRGRVVIGALPLHLAALCRKVGTLEMQIPANMRGLDLSLEECRILVGDGEIEWFVVRTLSDQQWLLDDACEGGNGLYATAMKPETAR